MSLQRARFDIYFDDPSKITMAILQGLKTLWWEDPRQHWSMNFLVRPHHIVIPKTSTRCGASINGWTSAYEWISDNSISKELSNFEMFLATQKIHEIIEKLI